jgi:hypothetical protein
LNQSAIVLPPTGSTLCSSARDCRIFVQLVPQKCDIEHRDFADKSRATLTIGYELTENWIARRQRFFRRFLQLGISCVDQPSQVTSER